MTDRPVSPFRLGTRGSVLAQRQTTLVAEALRRVHPTLEIEVRIITTLGDRVTHVPLPEMVETGGGQGVFTSALEEALLAGEIDAAVHSLKDMPTILISGTVIGAVLERENPADALISRHGLALAALPEGAAVGTSSRRRAAQLLRVRPDLRLRDVRGNVDTRIQKALDADGGYDAIILAMAGLSRLGRLEAVTEILPLEVMLPAPGQAAVAVQCHSDSAWGDLLAGVSHAGTEIAVTAERAFLRGLGGGCALPIAAYGHYDGGQLALHGRVLSPDGRQQIEAQQVFPISPDTSDRTQQAEAAGLMLADRMLESGAAELLETTS